MIKILDNTVLSNFAAVRRPDLVRVALGTQLVVPEQVFGEHQAGVLSGETPVVDWSCLQIRSVDDAARDLYDELLATLGAGEAACLALAVIHGFEIFTDDRDARGAALRLGVPVSGTLGILAILVRRRNMPLVEADALLRQMIDSGYRSPVISLAAIL